jgi:signal transduction histidine kinase
MLRLLTRPAIIWAAPLARLLICATILFALIEHGRSIMHLLVLAWIIWASVTASATLIGFYFRVRDLRIIAGIDALIGALTIFLMPGSEAPTIAFLVCAAVMVLGCGIGLASLAALVLVPLAAWGVQYLIEFGPAVQSQFVSLEGSKLQGMVLLLQFGALASVAALILRNAGVDTFVRECNSIDMLHPERSFEFDLQDLVTNLAGVFANERAFCLLTRGIRNSGYRQFNFNCGLSNVIGEIPQILSIVPLLSKRAAIYDIEDNICLPIDNERPRNFTEVEQKFATFLNREHFVVAIVLPIKIGRSRGILVCAASKPITACLVVDALKIEKNIAGLMNFLSRMAEAERQFIAEAHDVARRDLHDGVLQSMAALRMRLLTISKRPDLKKHPVQLELRKSADILTLEQVRLRGLLENSESENDTVNLVAQLDICLRAISLQWEVDAKMQSDEPAVPVDHETALNIEHLVREAVANAVRHAKISALTVMLSLKHDVLLIAINDRGNTGQSEQGGLSMPLQSASLQHRLRLVNGTAYSEGLGQGALLAISIPMQQVDDA